MKKCISWRLMINMKKLLVLFFVLLFSNYALAESSGSKITTGFINDNYGTSFYYNVKK